LDRGYHTGMTMGDYRRLGVWAKSHEFTLAVYAASAKFPRTELFGLQSQLRRSAASIPANIAEGCGRDTDGELARFLRVALGSANEAEYHLLLARDLGLLEPKPWECLTTQLRSVKRMLASFVERLQPFRRGSTRTRRPTADS